MAGLHWIAALAAALTWGAAATAETAELFGQADETWSAQVSPDGAHVALGCSPNGRLAVCIYPLAGGKPTLFQLREDQRLTGYYWASDTHLVGNINFFERITTSSGLKEYRIDRALAFNLETGKTAMLMRGQKNFTSLTEVASVCDARPDKVVMELSEVVEYENVTGKLANASARFIQSTLYEVDLNSGKSRRLDRSGKGAVDYILDRSCEPVADVVYREEEGAFQVRRAADNRAVYEATGVTVEPLYVLGMTDDESGLVVSMDTADRSGLHTIGLEDGALAPVEFGGEAVGEMGLIRDRFRATVAGYTYTNDLPEQVFVDPKLIDLHDTLAGALAGKTVRLLSWSRDRNLVTLSAEAPGEPVLFYLFDGAQGSVSPLGAAAPQLEGRQLGPVMAMSYAASDGMVIPAYLTLPPGRSKADGPFPLVLMPHGGPEARDTAAYDWWAQAYAAEGYAVLQPNFRGSAGYGAAFRNAGFGEFGGKMVTDVIDGAAFLETEGIAAPGGACIAGGSYGGYSAMMAAILDNDRIKCAIAVNPVTDVFSHMGRFDRGTAPNNYWARYAGGSAYASDAAKASITPAERLRELTAPLLLIHAREDTTVNVRQSRRIDRALTGREAFRYVEIEGEDHYLTSAASRKQVLQESLAFLAANHPAR